MLERQHRRRRLDTEPRQPRVLLVGPAHLVDQEQPHPLAPAGPQDERFPALVHGRGPPLPAVPRGVVLGRSVRGVVVDQAPRIGEHVPRVAVLGPAGDHHERAHRRARRRRPVRHRAHRHRDRRPREIRIRQLGQRREGGITRQYHPPQPPAAQPRVVDVVEPPQVVARTVRRPRRRVDVEGERLGDAERLLVDEHRPRVVPLARPPHPVHDEAVLLLVRALDQPDPHPLAGVAADGRGVRQGGGPRRLGALGLLDLGSASSAGSPGGTSCWVVNQVDGSRPRKVSGALR